MWYYKLANSESIEKSIKNFDWKKTFLNVDVTQQHGGAGLFQKEHRKKKRLCGPDKNYYYLCK